MKVDVTIPEHIGDITLRQYLKYDALMSATVDQFNFNRKKLNIFTGIPVSVIDKMKQSDYDRLLNSIDAALNTEAEFKDRFTMHGIEFGFIPNLDKMTAGEYADLTTYGTSTETLHNLMAILFRPIKESSGESYLIMPYDGSEQYAEMMKDMPLNCVNGALVFFYNLANELQKATEKFLTQELQREMQPPITSRISGGIQRLRDWLKTTSSISITLHD